VGTPLSILDYHQPVEFRIGDVILRSWNILSRHFLTFVLLVGIAELLPLVLTLYWGDFNARIVGARPEDVFRRMGVGAGIGLLQFVLSAFAQAIVVYAAFQDLRGRPVSASESFQQGIQRVFPAIIASVLSSMLIGIGLLLCLIPGIIAAAAMAVVLPACVVERMGPIESMSRSSDLTTGHRWPIVLVAIAWGVIAIVIALAIQAALPLESQLPAKLISWVWSVLATSYTSVYAAILYHDLRAVREGIGIHEIASVFD
jgi:hypothetical protein